MRPGKPLTIRDPVHGDIRLTAEEGEVLDSAPMQRLRGIRQLGTAHLVYPGATHTRFEHSIGTLHMAHLMCAAIRSAALERPADLAGIDPGAERRIRLAALVHDLSHIPFGHGLEDQSGLLERHDTPSRLARAVGEGEAGQLLDALGVRSEVLAILGAGGREIPPCWRELLDGTIGADILDYLARDSYFTGLSLRYDPRVLGLFQVDRKSGRLFVDVSKRGMLREDALSEVLRVLEARYYFSERVYYHHAKVTAGALLTRAIEEALDAGELDEAALFAHTDESLLAALCASACERAARFAGLYRRRRLPKRAAVYPAYLNRERQPELLARFFTPGRRAERRALEQAIAAEVQAATGRPTEIILYCPRREMQLKESALLVRFPGADALAPLSSFAERVPRVRDLEESYRNLWKLYLLSTDPDPRVLAAAARVAAGLLPGAVNAYH